MTEIGNAKTLLSQTVFGNSFKEVIQIFEEEYGFTEKYIYSISKMD